MFLSGVVLGFYMGLGLSNGLDYIKERYTLRKRIDFGNLLIYIIFWPLYI